MLAIYLKNSLELIKFYYFYWFYTIYIGVFAKFLIILFPLQLNKIGLCFKITKPFNVNELCVYCINLHKIVFTFIILEI